jgi:hypothetical protein
MPPVSWLHRHLRVSPAINDTPEPSGARPLCKLCLENSGSPDRARIPPPSLFGSSPERLQDAHRVPPGTHRTSGFHRTPPGVHRTPPGVHRRSIPHGRDFRDPPHDPQQHGQPRLSTGRLRSPTRCVVFATSVLGCSPEPPGSNRVPSETRSQFVQTRRSTAIASFRYKGPLVRRPLAEQCNVSGATVVTFESTPGFRLSYRREL